MLTFEFSVLMALSAVFAGASLVSSLRSALPRIAAIRDAAIECPEMREMRFTIRTVVVRIDDGKVVPLRQRRPAAVLNPGVRAAA